MWWGGVVPYPDETIAPNADVADGSWLNQAGSGANLYQSIDEVGSHDSDTTYIVCETGFAPNCPTTANSSVCEIGLAAPSQQPVPGQSVTVSVVAKRVDTGSAGTANLRVRLLDGATELNSATHAITTSYVEYTSQFTWGATWGHTNLRVEFRYTACVNSEGDDTVARVTQARVIFA